VGTVESSNELEQRLGERLRELRLLKNVNQETLAEQAGLSVKAVKHLESGQGARVASLIKVLRALGRSDWLETLAPVVSISPMQMLKADSRPRKRARRRASRRV
jgi:transcriptional regulator with XRE-family HTH domain